MSRKTKKGCNLLATVDLFTHHREKFADNEEYIMPIEKYCTYIRNFISQEELDTIDSLKEAIKSIYLAVINRRISELETELENL